MLVEYFTILLYTASYCYVSDAGELIVQNRFSFNYLIDLHLFTGCTVVRSSYFETYDVKTDQTTSSGLECMSTKRKSGRQTYYK